MIPQYNTELFCDIYPDLASFTTDAAASPIPTLVQSTTLQTIYYLLLARYGNNPIANLSVDAFKIKLFATIYQYGPTWEKRQEIQATLRSLTEGQLRTGGKTIMNTALHPGQAPSTGALDELTYIDQQNTSNNQKSILAAYSDLWEVLKVDVTENFLNAFKPLFKLVVIPERTYIYATEEED